MREEIHYDEHTKAIVFDEPIPEYRELMLIAASDKNHRLYNNYKTNILAEQVFMTMFVINDMPAVMFGLFQEPWMGSAARGLNRFYKPPYAREGTEYGNFNWHLNDIRLVNFYNDHPVHKKYGIDTIFITRNYTTARRDSLLAKRFDRDWKSPFKQYPKVLMYKEAPQRFYVWGDDRFLNCLPEYQTNE